MASFDLNYINRMTREDPQTLIAEGDIRYEASIRSAAELVAQRMADSPVVMLSGPSGSGKTTTAGKLMATLTAMGIRSHTISMDDYYRSRMEPDYPRTPEGEPDLESPFCLDIPLLNRHIEMLERGEEILVPHFIFSRQMRDTSNYTPLQVGKDEVVIFEGIHALNALFAHPKATKMLSSVFFQKLHSLKLYIMTHLS